MTSLIMFIVGSIFIILNKTIGTILYKIQKPIFRLLYGSVMDQPRIQKYYQWYVIYGGVLLFIIGVLILVSPFI